MTRLQWLRGHQGTIEYREWDKWLRAAASIRTRYAKAITDDDIFSYNETASVGVLATAAGRAGLLALPEFASFKREKDDLRRWRARAGRCDLWLHSIPTTRSWGFEFKQVWPQKRVAAGRLRDRLHAAVTDASCVNRQECDARYGALIVSLCLTDVEARLAVEPTLEYFAEETDYAARFGAGSGRVYLFFKHRP